MIKRPFFKTSCGIEIKLPAFFPDATRGVLKTLDSIDIEQTNIQGILVNTFHLYQNLDPKTIKKCDGIRNFMSWPKAVVSDSGGFQVMSLIKKNKNKGKITDQGIIFYPSKNKKIIFSPEESIRFQMLLKTDMVIVLDDFTEPNASYLQAKETVRRTILWARRSKEEFVKYCQKKGLREKNRPLLLAVVQGGDYFDLRKECLEKLVEIGFDGLGYGGWPLTVSGNFNYEIAKLIAKNSPKNYLLFGLGIGKPENIVNCSNMGFDLFDCVLPSRDARHRRLYVFRDKTIEKINLNHSLFYRYFIPDKEKYRNDTKPVSNACDCLLCRKYTRAYLNHLFRINENTAIRLATIHNLRFYSLLMEKLQIGKRVKN